MRLSALWSWWMLLAFMAAASLVFIGAWWAHGWAYRQGWIEGRNELRREIQKQLQPEPNRIELRPVMTAVGRPFGKKLYMDTEPPMSAYPWWPPDPPEAHWKPLKRERSWTYTLTPEGHWQVQRGAR